MTDAKTLLAPVARDLAATNDLIRERLASTVPLINQVAEYLIGAGGKRLRPATTLLVARALGAQAESDGRLPHLLAAVVEFVHTATLLHDDVVDSSATRRGRLTANNQWGNPAAVLSGDFLYSRSFQMMVDAARPAVMRVMADATNAISEGEVLQLLNARDPEVDEARYLKVIELKTARLFEAAAELGAIAADADPVAQKAMGAFGRALGMAYQMRDDVLDYEGDPAATGKVVGNDLMEGKPTLPLIFARDRADADTAGLIRRVLAGETPAPESLPGVRKAIESTGGLAYTARLADGYRRQAVTALEGVPASPFRQALVALAEFSVARDH